MADIKKAHRYARAEVEVDLPDYMKNEPKAPPTTVAGLRASGEGLLSPKTVAKIAGVAAAGAGGSKSVKALMRGGATVHGACCVERKPCFPASLRACVYMCAGVMLSLLCVDFKLHRPLIIARVLEAMFLCRCRCLLAEVRPDLMEPGYVINDTETVTRTRKIKRPDEVDVGEMPDPGITSPSGVGVKSESRQNLLGSPSPTRRPTPPMRGTMRTA